MCEQTKKILITVKAYPNPSKKYSETVCVAGIDLNKNEWIRLYPIPFRDLDDNKRFKKYNVIRVNVRKAIDDKRPESYKVNVGSIEILDYLDTKNKWKRRKGPVLSTLEKSMCEILRKKDKKDKSLGVFQPHSINFEFVKSKPKDAMTRKSCYAQLSLFNKNKQEIESIPYNFRYSFFCHNEPSCPGHKYPIIDWEIGQAYRDWRMRYKSEDILLEKIKERWLTRMCSRNNNVFFFVGNMKRFRDNFMVLGVFYPPK